MILPLTKLVFLDGLTNVYDRVSNNCDDGTTEGQCKQSHPGVDVINIYFEEI